MSSTSSFVEDQRKRRRFKFWSVFVGIFGASFSILTSVSSTCRPLLHTHFPQMFQSTLAWREQLLYAGCAALIGGVAAGYHEHKFNRVFSFFGVSDTLRVLFVLPTFRPVSTNAFKEVMVSGVAIKKDKTLEEGPIYSHHNFDIIFRALKRVPELQYTDIFFATDEEVMPVSRREPDAEHVDGKTVVSFGSNSSNNVCTFVLNQHPFIEQGFFFRFDDSRGFNAQTRHTGFSLVRNGAVPEHPLLPDRFEDDDQHDYAILLRHTTDFTTYFICAGLDPHGSESNTAYLFSHWKEIRKWAHGRDFYALARVNRSSGRGTPVLRATRKRSSSFYEVTFVSQDFRGS